MRGGLHATRERPPLLRAADPHVVQRRTRALPDEVPAPRLRDDRPHISIATMYVDLREREGLSMDGAPLCCHASTRKGTPCQRVPLPGSKYCPSHKHLDEEFSVTVTLTGARRGLAVDSSKRRAAMDGLRLPDRSAPGSLPRVLLGVDVGGTFTDAALIADGRLVTAKAPSTPDDQSRGVIDAVEAALEQGRRVRRGRRALRPRHDRRDERAARGQGRARPRCSRPRASPTWRSSAARRAPTCTGCARDTRRRSCRPSLRVAVPERCGPDGVLRELDEDELRVAHRRPARTTSSPRPSACSGASATTTTSARSPTRWASAASTSRPRTRPRACSASTSAARPRSSTPRSRPCCAATSSG